MLDPTTATAKPRIPHGRRPKDQSANLDPHVLQLYYDAQALADLPPIPQPKPWSDVQERLWIAAVSKAVLISVAGAAFGIPDSTQTSYWQAAEAYQAHPHDQSLPLYAGASAALLGRLKRADAAAHLGILSSIYDEKSWQARAWIGERRYNYRQQAEHTTAGIVINIGLAVSHPSPDARLTLDVEAVRELADPRRPLLSE